jgi:hypothetical protein
MTDELLDEAEAINSIYGEGCFTKVQSSDGEDIYILNLPNGASSLKLQFPDDYPNRSPPTVLGTHSSGENARRGDAARDLALFQEALETVFRPGEVCLFDAIEETARHLGPEPHSKSDDENKHQEHDPPPEAEETEQVPEFLSLPEPPWVLSDPVVELRSTFVARVAVVTSPSQAASYVQYLLATDRKVRSATHNITAWRIRGPNGTSFQDCDDDGETAAGGRLLHLMQLMDLWDAMVVVTRWYGGHKLGPRRFALINTAARDGFVKAGLVSEPGPMKKKGHSQ